MIQVPSAIQDLHQIPVPIAADIMQNLLNVIAEVGVEKERLNPIDYDFFFGGTPKIVESYEDLKQITVLVEHESGRWCNITEAPGDMDMALHIDDDWMLFLLCSNNSGGIGYYVPKWLIPSCPNLHLTILNAEQGNGEIASDQA
jgi:hypothetical protein